MQEIYNGYTIVYDECFKKFKAKIGNSDYSNADLVRVRKHIDDIDKKNYVRTDVIINSGWDAYRFLEATTTSEFYENGKFYVWVIDSKKNRSKESSKCVFIKNQENLNKISEIIKISKEITELNIKKNLLCEALEKYTPQISVGDNNE